jgi:dolichol-phosphate mannosyltransferase
VNPEYSVVIPMYNEEDNVESLINELEPVMKGLGKAWELICVDDGSTDTTGSKLKALEKQKAYLNPIYFSFNAGQSSAFDAGFKAAKSEVIITLDGDRQNDPTDIPLLLKSLEEGADLVCGIRKKRRDTIIKRVTSRLANTVRSRLCGDGMQDTGCSLKVYRRSCLQTIKLFEGMHRFLPALFSIEGYHCSQVPVNHRERVMGTSKYNFLNRSFNTVFDLFAVMWMRRRKLQYEVKRDS